MAAHYDTYDYPSYWDNRNYEHESEVLAINHFLKQIKNRGTIIEIGAGFGRLVHVYKDLFKKIIITEPSTKLLSIAKSKHNDKKISFIVSTLQTLTKKQKPNCADVLMMIRVAHHIKHMDKAFDTIHKLLKKDGMFILEFANKRHIKAVIIEFLRGNLTYALDIFPIDISSPKSKKEKSLPFINYHPDVIKKLLIDCGFEIVDQLSVSNMRIPIVKRFIPVSILIFFESIIQKHFSHHTYGPSIFILARKIG